MMAEVQIKLSDIWVALMLKYLLGDILRIYRGDFRAGEIGVKKITQGMWLGIAILMVIPSEGSGNKPKLNIASL